MFFIMGITEGRKDFDFNQLITCSICGKYGRFNVFMTYSAVSFLYTDFQVEQTLLCADELLWNCL
jgi:hypothetical protein